jgi:hypothetical protein
MMKQDRIFPITRILAGIVVPFLALAVLILYFYPDQTAQRFAWPVKPPINAMLMASAYGGGIYFFGSVILSRRWHTVEAGFLPVTVFASLLGIATLLHWDKFTHGHIAFILWAGLYFSTPFLVLVAWLNNRREDPGNSAVEALRLPSAWRVFYGLQALGTSGLGFFLFAFPALVLPVWPWVLTPLTARVLGALFALPGVLGLEIAHDPRWETAQRLLEAQFISFAMIFVAMLRARADFTTGGIFYYGFLLALITILAALILLFIQMKARATKVQHRTI